MVIVILLCLSFVPGTTLLVPLDSGLVPLVLSSSLSCSFECLLRICVCFRRYPAQGRGEDKMFGSEPTGHREKTQTGTSHFMLDSILL